MILSCPSCRARYVVPDSAIGPVGRKVRCASCRHSWFQEATQPEPELPPAPPAPSPEPPPFVSPPPQAEPAAEREPAPPEWEQNDAFGRDPPFRPRRNRARMWTWAAIVAALLMSLAVAAIYLFGLPDFGQRIGIPVQSADALAIVDENAETRRLERGNDVLEVSGAIVNQTEEVQRVPQLRAELKDGQGRTVYSWSIAPPVRELQPRGRVAFNSANVGVPRGGRVLSLTFAPVS